MYTGKHSKNWIRVSDFWRAALLLMIGSLFFACAEEQDPNNPNNNNPNNPPVSAKVEITGTSPEFTFWGDELTISGTGFSAKAEDNFVWIKNETASLGTCSGGSSTDSLGWRRATILSATATSLKIKVPYKTAAENDGKRPCGAMNPRISVTVGKSTAVSSPVKLVGRPYIFDVCAPNSGFKNAAVIPGKEMDNVLSVGGLGLYADDAGVDKKLKLTVGTATVPLEIYGLPFATCSGAFKFRLPSSLASGECSPDPILPGRFARNENFVISIDGTAIKSEPYSYPVASVPEITVQSIPSRRFSWSKGGNPEIRVKGMNVDWFSEARFLAVGATCTTTTIAPVAIGPEETVVGIPLANMKVGCSYQLVLRTNCGTSTGQLSTIIIDP